MVQFILGCLALVLGSVPSAQGELVVAKGLAVEPFATTEQLSNPSSIDVDDRGRVWVAEAVNYRKKARKEGDRILILEDTDGDGRADKTKVFYQDPDIDGVHGVCVLGNQAIVSAPDRILLLTDLDGDDKADEKKLLFKGKVLNPVHGQHDHAIHAVMFGPDGRLYFNFGNYSAGLWRADGSLVKDVFGNPVDNSRKPYQEGMVIRCEMDGSQVEVLGYNFRNNWEVTVDSFGSMWQSDNDAGSNSCRVNFVMEYGNYGYRDEKTGADYKTNRTNLEGTMQRRMWHQNDPGVIPNLLITGRGAPTGILVYEGNLLPESFRGQMIHAEPGRNVVWAFPTKQVGAGYQASITNLVHSKGDLNYRPSDVSVAPDGSLIIADWFDPVDCCHRTVNDAGRIFRVAPPKHAYSTPDFDFKTPAGAAKALRNPNLSVRYKAWTALQAMQEKARPALTKMAGDQNPRFRARALWALAAIKDGAQKAIEKALKDEDDNLRALALRIARRHGMPVEPLVRRLVRDDSALVRRECAVSLHRVATPKAAELWAELALRHDGKDRWYLEALGIGEKGNETACLKAWLKKIGDAWNAPAGRDLVWRSRAPEAAGLLVQLVLDPKVPESEHPRLMRALDFHSGKAKEDALATLLLNLAAPAEPKEAARPNIIFVLCDDLGAGDLGVLWQNQRSSKQKFATPNLDQFANEGMTLTRHYCPAPVCAPSRGSLLMGRHQGHCAIRNSQFDKEMPDEYTLGSVLQEVGYATAAIGKWGLQGGKYQLKKPGHRGDRSPELEPSHPLLRGFDFYYGYTGHYDGHYHYPLKGNRPMYDGYKDMTDGLAKCYTTDLFTARTKKWIADHHRTHPEQPFFTYLAYDTPHSPQQVPTTSHMTKTSNYPPGGGLTGGVQWIADANGGQINTAKGNIDQGMHPAFMNRVGDDGKPWPGHAIRHATMIRRIGDAVVDIVQLLKDLAIDENTLIVFTSDNGTHRADGHRPDYFDTFGPYDGQKRDMWEGGVRMPTFLRWPSVIAAESTSDVPSQFHDWMATFCDLAGVQSPALGDGVSLVPTLTGRGNQARSTVYSEFLGGWATQPYEEFEPSRRGRKRGQMQSILIGDYKGVRVNIQNHQGVFEVYHTLNDPKEATDLAGKAGVPTQQQFQAAVLRTRRIDPAAPRPYDNEQIPALVKRSTRPGLMRKEFPGQFPWVPQFNQLKPSGQSVVDGLQAAPGAQQFSGYLRVPKSGVYHFALTTRGKAVVRLHDALLIDADSHHKAGSKALSGKIPLQAGLHPLRINYLAGASDAKISLRWQVPGAQMKPIPNAQLCVENGSVK